MLSSPPFASTFYLFVGDWIENLKDKKGNLNKDSKTKETKPKERVEFYSSAKNNK